jgi:hypothetical protein
MHVTTTRRPILCAMVGERMTVLLGFVRQSCLGFVESFKLHVHISCSALSEDRHRLLFFGGNRKVYK